MDVVEFKEMFELLDLQKTLSESISETKEDLAESNRTQMYWGFDSTGALIGEKHPYLSTVYALRKEEMNPLPGFGKPDLYLTGTFNKSIKVDINSDTYKFTADDPNGLLDSDRYGDDVLGLNEQFKTDYVTEFLEPAFNEKIKQETGL